MLKAGIVGLPNVGKSTIKLQFTGPLEALGRMDNDVRVYNLHFTPGSS